MEYPKMKSEVKKQWVKALRSGEYEQGFGKLCTVNRYCCLGVLSEDQIKKGNPTIKSSEGTSGVKIFQFTSTSGSKNASQNTVSVGWFRDQFENPDPLSVTSPMNCLVSLNDKSKKSFNEIADWIEENL